VICNDKVLGVEAWNNNVTRLLSRINRQATPFSDVDAKWPSFYTLWNGTMPVMTDANNRLRLGSWFNIQSHLPKFILRYGENCVY
jgi:hypothetical protein